MKILLITIAMLSATSSYSEENTKPIAERKMASKESPEIFVQRIKNSNSTSERWIDNELGVVCYVAGGGKAISCFKFR